MDNQRSSNIFQRFWKWSQRNHIGWDQTGSHCRQVNPDGLTKESRVLEIERAERAERAALTRHVERLYNAQKAQTDSVLERLGLSTHATQPSPQPPVSPREGPCFHLKEINRIQRSWDEEDDDSFWDKVLLGGYMAALACKEAPLADRDESPTASVSPVDSLCSEIAYTPTELRAIPLIGSRVEVPPTLPPRAGLPSMRGASRLPVLSNRFIGKDKEVASGSRIQTTALKIEERVEDTRTNSQPSPRPLASPKNIAVTPLDPTPPKVCKTHRRGSRPGMFLRPAKAVNTVAKKTETSGNPKCANDKKELQPLRNPVESLSLCFKLLSSDDWMKKMKGLDTIKALAQNHSETLRAKLHEVCLVLTEEVKNLRSAVSCAAMDTIAELYTHLQKTMDPEVEGTGRALLLKLAQTTNAFIHQQANLALDAMVENCSNGRTVSTLLNTGMRHRCVAVRSSMAQHLHQLADRLGAAHILTAGKTFTQRFLSAVSTMSLDAAPEVRHHGQIILRELALHNHFQSLWTKIIPEKERRPLEKILKKTKN